MLGFVAGSVLTFLCIGLFYLLWPVFWLLTGGDLAGYHWLLDGEGSLRNRWHWRAYNGHNPLKPPYGGH